MKLKCRNCGSENIDFEQQFGIMASWHQTEDFQPSWECLELHFDKIKELDEENLYCFCTDCKISWYISSTRATNFLED